jgi:ABC-type branched-subunit amino acid transport system ATPase component
VTILAVRDLARHFGGVRALNGVTFELDEGERRAVIGPNGAGKTTLFNVLSGELRPTSGRVEAFGEDITGSPTWLLARRGIARVYQRTELCGAVSARGNVELALLRHQGVSPLGRVGPEVSRSAEEFLGRLGLEDRTSTPARALSHGERRQLELAVALATEPRLLLLDEPTAGMSPSETARIVELIAEFPRSLTLLIVEHDMDVVFRLAERITVLHEGRVVAEGEPREVRADARVREVYLGTEAAV